MRMAKKKAKPQSAARATTSPDRPDTRISIDEALQRLLVVYPAHVAAERLNTALRENRVRLWSNDKVVRPDFIRTGLAVNAVPEADGRWRGDVAPTRALDDSSYRWEVDPAGVSTLLPSASRKRGPKYTDDWPIEVARWLNKQVHRHGLDGLNNISKLAREAREFLQQQGVFVPDDDDDKALRRLIGKLLS